MASGKHRASVEIVTVQIGQLQLPRNAFLNNAPRRAKTARDAKRRQSEDLDDTFVHPGVPRRSPAMRKASLDNAPRPVKTTRDAKRQSENLDGTFVHPIVPHRSPATCRPSEGLYPRRASKSVMVQEPASLIRYRPAERPAPVYRQNSKFRERFSQALDMNAGNECSKKVSVPMYHEASKFPEPSTKSRLQGMLLHRKDELIDVGPASRSQVVWEHDPRLLAEGVKTRRVDALVHQPVDEATRDMMVEGEAFFVSPRKAPQPKHDNREWVEQVYMIGEKAVREAKLVNPTKAEALKEAKLRAEFTEWEAKQRGVDPFAGSKDSSKKKSSIRSKLSLSRKRDH